VPTLRAVQGDAGPLAVWDWPGAEPPTLLLHGVGNYGRYWDLFAEAIAGRLRLVAPDARGHGDSPKPADGYAVADFVADAVAILDACGIDRTLVVGHSMGGFHATAFAETHPDRTLGLVIVDAGPDPMPEGALRARRLSSERPASFADRSEAEEYLRRTSPGYADEVYENRLRWLFREQDGRLAWRSSRNALALILAGSRERSDPWARASDITAPTLIVRGTRSPVVAPDTARRLHRAIRGSELYEVDAAHNVALERPRELADAVAGFAARLERRGTR
jgi:pimeloyl-ACP methyl ester carboxylesterase